ncbi:IucA/IucC family protein [Paraherbaspirillum soli]|uniref:IucA/IucC family protein n=1 Tax=Paraherbaspirillum soli TaxID=631222 RepID=A0ABW0M8L9_9BURK
MHSTHPYQQRLAQDLFDALWLEDLYGFRSRCIFHPPAAGNDDAAVLEVVLDAERSLHWHGRPASGLRPFRVASRPAVLHTATLKLELELVKAVDTLQSADWWQDRSGRCARFFRLAERQAAHAAEHEARILARLAAAPEQLLSWEALSCLKDRPFHPLARAKDWGNIDATSYSAESTTALTLHWVAVPRDQVRGTDNAGQPLAATLLDPAQQAALHATAHACNAAGDAYLWLAVHPWQWSWFKRNAAASVLNACVDLGSGPGTATPTASLRSLAVTGCGATHLKLALSVNALGALRTLPPRYLHNGMLASACLQQLRQRDPWLAAHLSLCDEDRWWALSQENTLAAEPGQLACQIRTYPTPPAATLIPMAALPVQAANGTLPAFEHLLATADEDAAWTLFGTIARMLLELSLRCLAHGVMPELHGQNVLLVCRGRDVGGLLLRDHDTLRICPPLMQAQGVTVPAYEIDRSTPNTLELDSPQALLAYLQTLAIEVNLYAILAALAERYRRDEAHGWQLVRSALEDCLACVPLPPHIASDIRSLLLDAADWPFKQVLAPLLGRASFGTGMPSAMGRINNPVSHPA